MYGINSFLQKYSFFFLELNIYEIFSGTQRFFLKLLRAICENTYL